MIFIESSIFNKQLKNLEKKYPKIKNDFEDFKKNFNLELWKNLWKDIYKFRIWNSSIPVWKRWWFRIILFFVLKKDKVIPLTIYSKTDRNNINFKEIFVILSEILKEIKNTKR